MITGGPVKTKMSGTTPFLYFANLLPTQIKMRNPFPVATLQNKGKVRPRMVMHIVWVRFQKLVYKDIEWKSIPISKEHIVAFQVRFVFHTVHDHTVPTP
jgi:hypothetical protein